MSIVRAEDISIIEKELEKLDSNDLAIFDCDDVLTTIRSGVFKPNNRDFLKQWIRSSGISTAEIYDKFRIILKSESGTVVNPKMIDAINRLKDKNVRHMVLTSFSVQPMTDEPNPVAWRVETLKNFGYDFSKFWNEQRVELSEFMREHNPVFQNGILCCDIFPKSECLEKFFEYIDWQPKKIVFVDDMLRNLADVEDFCKRQKIEYVGIEYLESQQVNSYIPFSESIAELQLNTLKEKSLWLSDEQAEDEIR